MFRTWMAIAVRNLLREGIYSLISVAGLAVGVACFILIALFVRHELGFDRYHERAERVYRISRDFLPLGGRPEIHLAAMPAVAAPLLAEDFPQIEKVARLSLCNGANGGALVSNGSVTHHEPGFAAADNDLFEIFDFEWLHGDPRSALAAPSTGVVTATAARRYFGRTEVLGETLFLEDGTPVAITGVIGDLPDDTHLRFSMLVSLQTAAILGEQLARDWSLNCFHTYALLRQGADMADVQRGAGAFFERHLGEGASRVTTFTLQPVTDVHLRSGREGEMSPPGSAVTVAAFGVIASFVLVLAGINFTNLATARGARRAKEVGVRKAAGSGRRGLIAQFLAESTLIGVVGVAAAMIIARAALPAFSDFVQKDLALDYADPGTLASLVGLALVVGIAAGSYPAFYLSAFHPARVLRGDTSRGDGAATLRKALVVFQFAISIALIIATIVVYEQTRYAQQADLGYEKERIVVLSGSPARGLGSQWDTLKREWLTHPDIAGVTASSLIPGMTNNNSVSVSTPGVDPSSMTLMIVDFDFFETYDIDVLAGRTFSEEVAADRLVPPTAERPASAAFVVSDLAARRLGLTAEEAVGRSLVAFGVEGQVVGVVEDVRFESVRNAIKPIVYVVPPRREPGQLATLREASIRVTGRNLADSLAHIEAKWKELVPDQPIRRRFLDEDFENLYRDETKQAEILFSFSLLAIFVACLGVLGLASFATHQRAKEIGIRKVMGASVWDIVWLFTAEFAKLVLLANVIAWPVAYAAMRRWLEGFAYRVELGLPPFVAGASLALLVALLTAALTAVTAANRRPVQALRHE